MSRRLAALFASAIVSVMTQGVARADSGTPLLPSPAAHYPLGTHYRPLCPNADEHGRRCFGQILVDASGQLILDQTSPPGGWTPNELETAYGVPASGGKGTVIATYIGSHYTNAESDAAAYRAKFGLPPCTSASGCFTQITDHDGTDFSDLKDDGCSGTVGEESLDMDMLMAGCPSCNILLIEGNDSPAAIATAKSHGAVSLSMSWGYTPESESDCEQNFTPVPGLALFAASGDRGYTAKPGEPAACTNVVAVGWTQLATNSSARGYIDTLPSGWGSAGGCDSAQAKGTWQQDPSCSSRMISDLSANGDNVAAYCTSPAGSANWHVTGGSSASSPFTTGVLASLDVTGGSFGPAWVYENAAKFSDVTSGGPVQSCPQGAPEYFCNAVPGYDGPTGVGTPYGPMFAGSGGGGSVSTGGDGGAVSTGGTGGSGSTCMTPSGSYSQSCTGCAAEQMGSGCVLTCKTCTEINGSENSGPSLGLPCSGEIANNNGVLQCTPSTSGSTGSSASGGASTNDAGTELDASAPPPSGGGQGGTGGAPTSNGGASTVIAGAGGSAGMNSVVSAGPGAGTVGTMSMTGATGCGCSEAGSGRVPVSVLWVGGLFLAWAGGRRRRRAIG
ncbi:MAG TPA: hypothetical protein VHW01_06375 [Polyangiaceae bacterium]|nr:hypothetical protein [Polyangiaceae bacterium]